MYTTAREVLPDAVTLAAQAGYRGDMEARPAYLSSPCGLAYVAGMQHRMNGGQFPTRAGMSRGYAVRVNGTVYPESECQAARLVVAGSRWASAQAGV